MPGRATQKLLDYLEFCIVHEVHDLVLQSRLIFCGLYFGEELKTDCSVRYRQLCRIVYAAQLCLVFPAPNQREVQRLEH
jgi:hypothetical protein